MSDINSQAAKDFFREVRQFSEQTKLWEASLTHTVMLDEIWDATLVSFRVYGTDDEFLTIMAAAGIDTVDQELPQKTLVLPTMSQLYAIKRRVGFESVAYYRENGKPTWVD